MQIPQKQQSRDAFFAELSAAARAKAEAEAGNGAGNGAWGGHGDGSRAGSPSGPLRGAPAGGGSAHASGHVTGYVTDDITDDDAGHVAGHIAGHITGYVAGHMTGDVTEPITDRRTAPRRAEDRTEDRAENRTQDAAAGSAPPAAPWIRPDWMTQERSPLDRNAPPPLPARGSGEPAGLDAALASAFEPTLEATLEATGGAGLAHDASNLLAALMLYSELLATPGVLAERHRHYAHDLSLLAERCQRLIDRLVSFGGAVDRERDRPVARAQVSLVDVLMRCEGLLSTLARRSLQITFGGQAALPVAIAPEPLERILVNLVKNAGRATQQGGAVRIGVGLQSGPQQTGTQPSGAQRMVLTVDDSGCGMSEAEIERVLQTTAPAVGLAVGRRQGIGLRVVRELVAASGGQLRIYSRMGVGTRVEIRWPVAGGEAIPSLAQPLRAAPGSPAGGPEARAAVPGRIARMEMVGEMAGEMAGAPGAEAMPDLASTAPQEQNARPDCDSCTVQDDGRVAGQDDGRATRSAARPALGELTAAERRLLAPGGRAGKGTAVSCSPGFQQSRKGAIAC